MTKARYGFYFPWVYIGSWVAISAIGLLLVLLGALLYMPVLTTFGYLSAAYAALSTIAAVLARYVIPGSPVTVARRVIASLTLTGSEKVLDIGSGRGLFAIQAAKYLTTGRVVGIDVWEPDQVAHLTFHHALSQPTGNTMAHARLNAAAEGVAEKVQLLNMDANHLQFGPDTFDIVVCGYVLGHLGHHASAVVRDIHRVLKPHGQLVIIDNVRDVTYMLLSTPHLYILSYMRGKKARTLTTSYWSSLAVETGFHLRGLQQGRGIITLQLMPEID